MKATIYFKIQLKFMLPTNHQLRLIGLYKTKRNKYKIECIPSKLTFDKSVYTI